MPHIHTNPGDHDHTVTAYILRLDQAEPQVLLHMHKKYNLLLPVGGHIEINESPWQAIAHELLEESGYDLSQLKILQPKQRITSLDKLVLHPYPLVLNTHQVRPEHFHSDTAFAFIADSEPNNNVGEGESTDLRWVTKSDLSKLKEPEILNGTKTIYQFLMDIFPDWEQVPTSSFQL